MKNRVISASAGTGKTHRLAVEYITILIKNLNYSDFHFERILVVTFTRKAAAEIRNKIFSMLDSILLEKDLSLLKQLEKSSGIILNEVVLTKLQIINNKIKTQKDKVRISTIDSLINQVFKTMIAPIMKLSHYTIEDSANHDVWEQILKEFMQENNFVILQRLNELNPQKNVESLGNIFSGLIKDRWIFHFLGETPPLPYYISKQYTSLEEKTSGDQKIIENKGICARKAFQDIFADYTQRLYNLILQKLSEDKTNKSFNTYLNKIVADIFGIDKLYVNEHNFLKLCNNFTEKRMFEMHKQNIHNIIEKDSIKLYSGIYIKKEPLGSVDDLKKAFLHFVYFEYVCKEYYQIKDLWKIIISKYDKIKQKSAVLSYSDISWYTYKFLYDPEYSMIDKNRLIVENQFYEFLAVRNQYLLIDEFQDTSLIQFLILAPMMNELSSGESIYDDTAVIVVGDEKQSIYGWRGGVRELLGYMKGFLRAEEETLKTCYRSVQTIVDFVNLLFSRNISSKSENNLPPEQKKNIDKWQYPEGIISAKKDEIGSVCNLFFKVNNQTREDSCFEFVEKLVKPAWESGSHKSFDSKCAEFKAKSRFQSEDEVSLKLGETAILARTNEELEIISRHLVACNIPFVKESARSIFDHAIPKAILNLMRYIQYLDYNALLKFLRSDILLLDSIELKQIAIYFSNKSFNSSIFDENNTLKNNAFAKINDVYEKYHSSQEIDILYKNPFILCKYIIDSFDIANVYKNEVDIKNLHTFVCIVSDFLNNPKEFSADLGGFIRYSEVERKKRNQKQLSTTENKSIKLLTIHKAKGLGFDTLFLYFEVQARKTPFTTLDIDYTVDVCNFNRLNSIFLGLNYKPVIKELFSSEYEQIQERKDLEELNNIYVALTRAKTNLGVFWVYNEMCFESKKKNIKTELFFRAKEISEMQPKLYANKDFISIAEADEVDFVTNDLKQYSHYFDIENKSLILLEHLQNNSENLNRINDHYSLPVEENDIALKHIYITRKSKLYGNAIHSYLSFIKYNEPGEHKIAYLQTLRLYGNILTISEIEDIIKRIKKFIIFNNDLFCRDWDRIFCEYSIINLKKDLFRIDRLMINSFEKKILIVDYKTGQTANEKQIEHYKLLLHQLPIISKRQFNIETRFVSV